MKRTYDSLWLLFVVLAAGCGGGGSETPNVPDDQPDDTGAYRLEFVTGPNISVTRNAQTELTVRYMSPKDEPVDGSVWFDVDGDANGSTLDSAGGATNADGEATVHLRAGSTAASFDVIASADYADPISFRITVEETSGPG